MPLSHVISDGRGGGSPRHPARSFIDTRHTGPSPALTRPQSSPCWRGRLFQLPQARGLSPPQPPQPDRRGRPLFQRTVRRDPCSEGGPSAEALKSRRFVLRSHRAPWWPHAPLHVCNQSHRRRQSVCSVDCSTKIIASRVKLPVTAHRAKTYSQEESVSTHKGTPG